VFLHSLRHHHRGQRSWPGVTKAGVLFFFIEVFLVISFLEIFGNIRTMVESVDENQNRIRRVLLYIPLVSCICNLVQCLKRKVCSFFSGVKNFLINLCKSIVCGVIRKKQELIRRIKDWFTNLFYKIIHVIIAVGLLILFPIMFLFVSPLYARRLIVRFQMWWFVNYFESQPWLYDRGIWDRIRKLYENYHIASVEWKFDVKYLTFGLM
jgi:hypothetical protein